MIVDRSGIIKIKTLENLVFNGIQNWVSAKELSMNPVFDAYPYLSGWRCLSIRLQRYWRQGLLERKRFGRCFKYRITFKGAQRLCYLWRKHGLLSSPKDASLTDEERETKTRLAEIRLNYYKQLNTKSAQEFKEKQDELEKSREHLWDLVPITMTPVEANRLIKEIFLKKKSTP